MSAAKTPPTPPAATSARPEPANRRPEDDDEEEWRHPPVAPKDEDPLKSLGRSVSEVVTGPLDDKADKPKA